MCMSLYGCSVAWEQGYVHMLPVQMSIPTPFSETTYNHSLSTLLTVSQSTWGHNCTQMNLPLASFFWSTWTELEITVGHWTISWFCLSKLTLVGQTIWMYQCHWPHTVILSPCIWLICLSTVGNHMPRPRGLSWKICSPGPYISKY